MSLSSIRQQLLGTSATVFDGTRMNARTHRKQLQRKIFLNTMRNVYPNSLRIKYDYSWDENRYVLQPISAKAKCKSIDDKEWSELMYRLNDIWTSHIIHRERLMISVWSLMTFATSLYISFGITTGILLDQMWYGAIGAVTVLMGILIIPTVTFTYGAMKPMLKHIDNWKYQCNIKLDKMGIEVVKITSGEILSDKSSYKWLGAIYYGSLIWFRYEDAEMEIFWRYIKSGKHVRRYSLMMASNAESKQERCEISISDGQRELEPKGSASTTYDTLLTVSESPRASASLLEK